MTNNLLGKIILLAMGLAILTVVFEKEVSYATFENLTVISGLAIFFFGGWGAIKLIKDKE
ncbi:MAG: hypothetical protein PF549_02775 [Patescibacteria group bacterium]|jgi:hypothetical protein|nr:hypothetical protein [Patescibacteria group bacterium]